MRTPPTSGMAWFPNAMGGLLLTDPSEAIVARRIEEVRPAIARIEAAVDGGRYAAGYLAYEAAAAFDAALRTHDAGDLPLLWFGLYDAPSAGAPPEEDGLFHVGSWDAQISEDEYSRAIATIHDHIAAGATYQANFTFPLRADFSGPALPWFRQLCRAQGRGPFAYLHTGDFEILSISPELFFERRGKRVATRPMKGTRPRGRWAEEDAAHAAALRASPKECAENVMIVDLLRNDLGRIAEVGTVKVEELFAVERYETVWQMTSTVAAQTEDGLAETFAALFPCGSVTGAPKVETMKIIRALERYPRGVYCGSVGWAAPKGGACFNVPIRTVTIDRRRGEACYHVGSGVTWDSVAQLEYRECLDKAAILSFSRPPFRILESLLHDEGYLLLDEHLERLRRTADYFGYATDIEQLRLALEEYVPRLGAAPAKVRLLVDKDGEIEIQHAKAGPSPPLRLGLAKTPVDPRDPFLYHKTTNRTVYERALAERPDCDDVLLWNEDGEITESSRANVVVDLDGASYTPPVACGLLAGTFRGHLLERGEIFERPITREDLARATGIRLINSVRRWIETEWVDGAT